MTGERIPYEVETLDAVPEALRGLYAQDGERWRLSVEGLPDVRALEEARRRANQEAAERRAELKAWRALGAGPEEVAEMLAASRKGADEETREMLRRLKAERDEARKAAQEAERQRRETETMGAIAQALTAAGVTPEGARLLPVALRQRLRYAEDGGVVVLDEHGQPMTGSGESGGATLQDLIAETVAAYPGLFRAPTAPGSGRRPGAAGGAGGLRRSAMTDAEVLEYQRQHGIAAYLRLPR